MGGGGGDAAAPASLSLGTTPSGATVLVNGDTAGTTPVDGYTLEAGAAQIEIRKDGFSPLDTTLTLEAGSRRALQGLQLARAQTPGDDARADAEALADASDQTDDSEQAPPTADDPSASSEASPAAEQQSETPSGDDPSAEESSPAEPTPDDAEPTGTLSVTPEPSGTVLVDGEQQSGIGAIQVPAGEHTVACRHPDRGTVETTVAVAEGQTESLTCYFEQKVDVTTTGVYGRIWINGEDTGKNTNAAFSLPPGTHRIEVRRRSIQSFQVNGGRVKVSRDGDGQIESFSGSAYALQIEPSFEPVEHAIVFNVSTD
jgi:hypothetical protein